MFSVFVVKLKDNIISQRGMGLNIKRWEVAELDKKNAARLAEEYNIPSFPAMLADIRGEEELLEAMATGENMLVSDPFLLKDMDRAVLRIQKAIDSFEKISVYGDYDADGVTSTAMLFSYLETVGADVIYYIPQREGEGYGLNMQAVDRLHQEDVKLIITVDNGIASVKEVEYAKSLGIEVVITDHHRPHSQLPDAAAVVDPYREDCQSEFKDLCGAGVTLKLIMALEDGDVDSVMAEYSDLAAIATVADVVSVKGENRTIINTGIQQMSVTSRPGLRLLLEKSGCVGKQITARMLAFTLVPRINATGRMGNADRAVRLLTCEYEEEAEILAEEICQENDNRKKIEAEILKEALAQIDESPEMRYDRVLVVAGENWHHGVIGIVAARITDLYGKPSIVISSGGEEAKGSGRSVEGFSLFDAICSCEQLMIKYGGHPMAAGISLLSENIEQLRININEYAKAVCNEMPAQTIKLDCKLNPASLSVEMADSLLMLEPFGSDNPYPLFGLYNMKIEKITPVGGGGHLRINCARNGTAVTVMCFGTTEEDFAYQQGDMVDMAVSLEAREFRAVRQLTVQVKDIKYSHLEQDESIHSYRLYEKIRRGEEINQEAAAEITPERDELAVIYRSIAAVSGKRQSVLSLLMKLSEQNISLGKLLIGMDIFSERGLANYELDGANISIELVPKNGSRIDIYESVIFEQIKGLVSKTTA